MTFKITIAIFLCLPLHLFAAIQFLPDDISEPRYNHHQIPPNFQIYSEFDVITLRFPSISY